MNHFYLDYNHRQENAVECIYAKMMQMHHRAPIVNISIIDRNGPISVYDESSQSNTHQLIVTTEEQIKGTVHKKNRKSTGNRRKSENRKLPNDQYVLLAKLCLPIKFEILPI